MGSNYYGEGFLSSSSSSRKGKKGNSDKPKQPQRGLGVAQLEKIRLHTQLGCSYNIPNYAHNFNQEDIRLQTPYSSSSSPSYGFQGSHGVMMGLPDLDRGNIRYGDSLPTNVGHHGRWHSGNAGFGHFVEPSMTRSFLEPGVEGSSHNNMKNKKDRNDSLIMGSNFQNSESCSTQDIDLELRLSL
ncbi:hypothetical protein ACJIZ3_021195 [Penstemon smallii]|uniref:Uncharacterized protein n=1 Tax=Penstemon smallii TaxID=265156 RepID=A0ABD3SLA5_9LAMI